MKYAEFIFKGVKAASDYGELDATFQEFILGNLAQDERYASFIDKATHEGNAFLQRISARGIVPAKAISLEPLGNREPSIEMPSDFLRAVSVFQYRDDKNRSRGYDTVQFKKVGKEIILIGSYSPYRKIHIQYRVALPVLGQDDIPYITELVDSDGQSQYMVGGETFESYDEALAQAKETDIDFNDEFGITDEVMLLGVDWIGARCRDDKSKGHQEEMEVESRLNDIADDENLFLQTGTGAAL